MLGKLFKLPTKPTQAPLTKITTPTHELLPRLNASPEAQALYQPGQSPGELLQALEQNQNPLESVNLLAHGMPEQDAVKWAAESSKMVGDKLNPSDQSALAATEKWLADPSPANQAAAAQAAAAANGSGPGGWAAQSAAWAQPAAKGSQMANAASGGASAGAAPGMAASAAAGAVLLAAGLVDKPPMPDTPRPNMELAKTQIPELPTRNIPEAPATPEAPKMMPAEAEAFSRKLKPFLDLGKNIASGVG